MPRPRLAWRYLAGLAAMALGVAVVPFLSDPPRALQPTSKTGTSWILPLGAQGARPTQANGITGRVVGESELDLPPGEFTWAGSNGAFTLLAGKGRSVLLDDATHVPVSIETGESIARLVDSTVWSVPAVGGSAVRRQIPDVGRTEEVRIDGLALDDAPPVVAEGAVWSLRQIDGGREVVRLPAEGSEPRRIRVSLETSGLAVVDGSPYAVTPGGLQGLGERGGQFVVAGATVHPAVAEDRRGVWATANGTSVSVTGNRTLQLTAEEPVRRLAVWRGMVWLIAGTSLFVVPADGSTLQRLDSPYPDGLDYGDATFRVDGGRLWVGGTRAVASIGERPEAVQFLLTRVSAEFCAAGVCSTEEFQRRQNDGTTTTTAPAAQDATTTTLGASTTLPPAVELPEITLPPRSTVPTTLPARGPQTTTTLARPTTTAAPNGETPAVTSPGAPSTTGGSGGDAGSGTAPDEGTTPTTPGGGNRPTTTRPTVTTAPPITAAPTTLVPMPTTTRPRTTTTDPDIPTTEPPSTIAPTTSTTTTTTPPTELRAVDVRLDGNRRIVGRVLVSDGSCTARLEWQATRSSGSIDRGSQTLELQGGWNDFSVSPNSTYTSVGVRVSQCGPDALTDAESISGTRSGSSSGINFIRADTAESIASGAPVGVTLRAVSQIRINPGWNVNANWQLSGACGTEVSRQTLDDSPRWQVRDASLAIEFTPNSPGTCSVGLVLSFTPTDGGNSQSDNKSADVVVVN